MAVFRVVEELFLRTILETRKKNIYIYIYVFFFPQTGTPELLLLWILEFLIDDLLSCSLTLEWQTRI